MYKGRSGKGMPLIRLKDNYCMTNHEVRKEEGTNAIMRWRYKTYIIGASSKARLAS